MAITTAPTHPPANPPSTAGVSYGIAWTASDDNYFANSLGGTEHRFVSRGISVSSAGTYEITMASGETDVIAHLAAGVIHPIRAVKVKTGGSGTGDIIVWK